MGAHHDATPSKTRQPSYRLHIPKGQAVVTIDGKDRYLGPHGSPKSHSEYAEWIAKWQDRHGSDDQAPFEQAVRHLSDNELLERCWNEHFGSYYSENGEPTTEAANLLTVIKTVSQLYGTSSSAEFGPPGS